MIYCSLDPEEGRRRRKGIRRGRSRVGASLGKTRWEKQGNGERTCEWQIHCHMVRSIEQKLSA